MNLSTEIEALRMVLEAVMDGHPDPELAIAQVDALIAEMRKNMAGSLQLQAADPLRVAVENIRATLV
jgi:hypothetical protein